MLTLFTSLRDLNFSAFMQVYSETNERDCCERYPHLPENLGIMQVEQDFYAYLRDAFFRTDGAQYAVWSANNRYVSAVRLEPFRDGLLLAGLETARNDRKKGYAAALLRMLLSHTSTAALPVYSHVSKRNIASLRTHEACGFRVHLDHAVLIDGSVDSGSFTLIYSK